MLPLPCMLRSVSAIAVVCTLSALPLRASEVNGTVTSVDASARKIVLSPNNGQESLELKVNASTIFETAKGKTPKKFSIERLNVGGRLQVTYEDGVAKKVVLGKGAKKKKNK